MTSEDINTQEGKGNWGGERLVRDWQHEGGIIAVVAAEKNPEGTGVFTATSWLCRIQYVMAMAVSRSLVMVHVEQKHSEWYFTSFSHSIVYVQIAYKIHSKKNENMT